MKILNIVADNFKLCADNFTLSFLPTANKTKDDKEFELLEIDDELYVFNTIGIIGKNASGKTTAVELLSIVYDLFSNYRIKNSIDSFKFSEKPLHLDVTFYHDGYLYRYLTDLFKDFSSVDSSVVLVGNERLFKRKYYKTYSKNILNYNEFDEIFCPLPLPNDTSMLYMIFEKIDIRGIYCSSDDEIYKNYAGAFNIYKMIDGNLDIITSLLKIFDEHLDNIEMIDDNKFKIIYSNKTNKIVTNNELCEILSSGTTKGFGLFTFVIYSLKTGTDLIIDEIENHFHKTLVENLVSLFKDKTVNKKNATLIFTTHYCELLDLFGRSDNIYISKFDKNIRLENMHNDYNFRSELRKSNKFYTNEFKTDVDYNALMNFKKKLM